MINIKRFRFRIFIPAFSNFNTYSSLSRFTTSTGPIYVATHANKLERWDVEVIDENNCHGRFYPRDQHHRLDHQQLQAERPADVVGFYASISSTIPRVYELVQFYKRSGVKTVAGGKHVEAFVEEALAHDIDVVVLGEGELTIKDLLLAWEHNQDLSTVQGIAFLKDGSIHITEKRPLIHDFESHPFPDFNLLRYAKLKLYPVTRTRGCNSNCEFCAVKEKARCSSPEYMMDQIRHLVENCGARHFFETSDHFAAHREEAIEFCDLLADYQKRYRLRLRISVQTRITDARYPDLLEAMRRANIYTLCIGYDSPIDDELKLMRKGYLSKDLLRWTDTLHRYGFFIHGMFIFGYPRKSGDAPSSLSLQERAKYFREFIQKAKIDTLQVLPAIPAPGSELRERLMREQRVFPLHQLGWEYYDGHFPLFMPDDGAEPEELYHCVWDMMRRFYHVGNFWSLAKGILFYFPIIVGINGLTIVTGSVKHLIAAYHFWYEKYCRIYLFRAGGYFIVKKWFKSLRKSIFLEKLVHAKAELKAESMKSA
ncbi:MAG: B12-binding domain-containing radical SAM protein [Desulfobacteraceae bacterium]|nr:B12-binding domain-containing radical SAM protein [Desulfobacteraceae bacterium]